MALFFQKASRQAHRPVIWDYHVILLLQRRSLSDKTVDGGSLATRSLSAPDILSASDSESLVYDFDSYLPSPCPWKEYLTLTFPPQILPEYQSSFRVVGEQMYLENFVSDRSHMLIEDARDVEGDSLDASYDSLPSNILPPGETAPNSDKATYSAPPPSYPPIRGTSMIESSVKTNLMSQFVSMEGGFGIVVERAKIEGGCA